MHLAIRDVNTPLFQQDKNGLQFYVYCAHFAAICVLSFALEIIEQRGISYSLSIDRLRLSLSLRPYCECLGHITALLNRFYIKHWVTDNNVRHALFTLKTYVAIFILVFDFSEEK